MDMTMTLITVLMALYIVLGLLAVYHIYNRPLTPTKQVLDFRKPEGSTTWTNGQGWDEGMHALDDKSNKIINRWKQKGLLGPDEC